MATYDFTAVVTGLDLEDYDQVDRLFAESFVVLPADREGVTTLGVEINAGSSQDALRVFMEHMGGVPDVQVERIDEDLINMSEIAARLDLSRETPRLWAARDRAEGLPFPDHYTIVGSPGKPQRLWRWVNVFDWVQATGRADISHLSAPLDASVVTLFNARLLVSCGVTDVGDASR